MTFQDLLLVFGVVIQNVFLTSCVSLFPYESETREVKALDGLWTFCVSPKDDHNIGFKEKWFHSARVLKDHCQLMPVPSSYNDITVDPKVRDFVGWAWYQRTLFVPSRWKEENRSIYIRFGSVHYNSIVWMNGQQVGEHTGGHLPFQVEVTSQLKYSSANLLTVAVNNTLTTDTLPQMQIHHTNDSSMYPPGYVIYSQKFDFFNYAGIHRPVYLVALPQVHIEDITVTTSTWPLPPFVSYSGITGVIQFSVAHSQNHLSNKILCKIGVLNESGMMIQQSLHNCTSQVEIPNVKLWWPRFSHPNPGYMYTLEVTLLRNYEVTDVYRLPFGVRDVSWDNSNLLINGEAVYLRGFGMHEDSNLRGKGLDYVLIARDFELIDWLGANAFRTSHYPYSEETLNMADRYGILVIAESPACTIDSFGEKILANHKVIMNELIMRDKNRPSVIAWSIANEPYSDKKEASEYFGALANMIRNIDATRAVTFVTSRHWDNDNAVHHMDIICVNRYVSWYSDSGHTSLIVHQTVTELEAWHNKWQRPIIMSEYGAGSLSGFHKLPAVMWTEDYQSTVLQRHFIAFDQLRTKGLLAGEMIWNFADFATPQEFTRPGGCMKGLMTRDRQPKAAAYVARKRFWKLAQNLSGVNQPDDLMDLD